MEPAGFSLREPERLSTTEVRSGASDAPPRGGWRILVRPGPHRLWVRQCPYALVEVP
jgi:hypothetical protein